MAAAVQWYEEHSRSAADRFALAVETAVDRILCSPGSFPASAYGTRRLVMNRFPFLIAFRESGSFVQVIAVAHASRRPGYWKDRLTSH